MRLIILGAGGHAQVCAEIASASGAFASVCYCDNELKKGSELAGGTVRFTDSDLPVLASDEYQAFVGVGFVMNPSLRIRLYEYVRDLGFGFPVLTSRTAHLSDTASIASGTMIGHMAVINTAAEVGTNCIINSNAVVEHNAYVGDHVHISTGAVVNGEARVGDRCMLGSHATVNHGIEICADVVVGSGAVVVQNIDEPGVYVGVPARKLR